MVVFAKYLLSRLAATGGGGKDSTSSGGDMQVGILAFESARATSRLVSLHRFLSDASINHLLSTTIQSYAVSYLNSSNSDYLFRLACAELLDDLDRSAAAICRLAAHSSSAWPRGFDQVYSDLKSGTADFGRRLGFPSKLVEKKMKKMEAIVAATSNLYMEMETLAEMEASERKLERWKNYSGPLTVGQPPPPPQNPPGAEAFLKKLAAQRKLVKKLQEESLWSQSKEKIAELMARAAVTIFARICAIFNTYVPELPVVDTDRYGKFKANPNPQKLRIFPNHVSGPLDRPAPAAGNYSMSIKFSGPILRTPPAPTTKSKDLLKWTMEVMEPHQDTVGAAGLALRYADVIAFAEKMFQSPEYSGEEDREELYQMLPGSLRAALRAKLRTGVAAAEGRNWREDARKVLQWLAPIAHDTIKWFSDRSCEKQKISPTPKVLMLQTLQISDRATTEEAIVDVLVGLSSLYQDQ